MVSITIKATVASLGTSERLSFFLIYSIIYLFIIIFNGGGSLSSGRRQHEGRGLCSPGGPAPRECSSGFQSRWRWPAPEVLLLGGCSSGLWMPWRKGNVLSSLTVPGEDELRRESSLSSYLLFDNRVEPANADFPWQNAWREEIRLALFTAVSFVRSQGCWSNREPVAAAGK